VPFVSPVTVVVRAPLDHGVVAPPGFAATVYAVISEPPLDDGALQVTTAWALPAVTETFVGAPGSAAGVTALEVGDATLVRALLDAVTENVYAIPFVSPVTVAVSAPLAQVAVRPPGFAVTVYALIGELPLEAGAVQLTIA